jgi:hypothetical protein
MPKTKLYKNEIINNGFSGTSYIRTEKLEDEMNPNLFKYLITLFKFLINK